MIDNIYSTRDLADLGIDLATGSVALIHATRGNEAISSDYYF